jgi:O-antigen/teichoic acid export membrane protein
MLSRVSRLVKAIPSTNIVRASVFMLGIHALASVFNYLYQVLVANFLSPEKYGILPSTTRNFGDRCSA